MRLIDADRLRAKITAMVTRPHQFMYEIERAPTVEAIPKEWLLNHMEVGNDEQNKVVHDLVKLWEKENGK